MGYRSKQRILNRKISNNQKCLRSCSTYLVIRKMQIKIILRYHLTPVRKPKIKKKNPMTIYAGGSEE